MKVSIKTFDVDMEVKRNGIEFAVYNNSGEFRGDMFITQSGLIWCEGRTRREGGVKVSWDEFIDWMNS